jgi:BirA family biotin operon repressor/biotin-[acetyl-CoA-carboxylase] ligase
MEIPQITQHIHLDTIDSTQSYLRDNYHGGNVLVSAKEQTSGFGRQGKLWIHQKDSLAFSFSLRPCEIPTLTPLEVAVLIGIFFKEHNLKLKWPNDLLNEKGEKCGGILTQNIDGILFIGVGINLSLGRSIEERKSYPAGSLNIGNVSLKKLSNDIYQFILSNRLAPSKIRELWPKSCIHLNKEVEIDDICGVFKGIGPIGEALVSNKSIYSGQLSLRP